LNPPFEALDPLEQGAGLVVDLRMGEPDDGHLERDAGVEGIAHRYHRRPEQFHGPNAASWSEQQVSMRHRTGRQGTGRIGLVQDRGCESGKELATQLVEQPGGYSQGVIASDKCPVDRLQGTSGVAFGQRDEKLLQERAVVLDNASRHDLVKGG
jgi:hypothetical protein